MKHLLLISSTLLLNTAIAQNKLLTIQDAVLKGRTTLAPKRLQSLSFIPSSTKFSYIDNNVLKIVENVTAKTNDVLSLKNINDV